MTVLAGPLAQMGFGGVTLSVSPPLAVYHLCHGNAFLFHVAPKDFDLGGSYRYGLIGY